MDGGIKVFTGLTSSSRTVGSLISAPLPAKSLEISTQKTEKFYKLKINLSFSNIK
jgi:hypothetical protein